MNHRLHRLTFRAAVAFTASLAIASTGARAQSTTSDARERDGDDGVQRAAHRVIRSL